MKSTILLCVIVGTVICKPDGFYRQEYQFKKSSSSYKNNELQTKDDDEGFYTKHGDLEGKSAPQINQNNEHREFVNPALGGVGHTITTYGDRDLTQEAENVFNRHSVGGGLTSTGMEASTGQNLGGQRRAYSSYSSYSSTGQTGGSGGYQTPTYDTHQKAATYDTHSNLEQLMQNVQSDLSQKVEDSVKQYQYTSSHSTSTNNDLHTLEDELRRNLNKELNEALYKKYGNQGRVGSYSYTVSSSGVYNPQANYDNQELTDLRAQLEQQLLKQLRDKVRTVQTQTSSYSQTSRTYGGNAQVHRDSAEVEDLNRHPTRYMQPQYKTTTYPPLVHQPADDLQQNERVSYAGMVRGRIPEDTHTTGTQTNSYSTKTAYRTAYQPTYTESIVVNPTIRVTDVVQNVQNKLSQEINDAVRTFEERYTSSSYLLTNSRPNYQATVDDFKRELRYNLTQNLREELERNYGRQVQRGEYSFSSGAGNVANYRVSDLENLRKQVEDNLIQHLENSFQQQEQRYVASASSTRTYGRDYTQHSPQYTQHLTNDNAPRTTYVRVKVTPVVHPQSGYTSVSRPTIDQHDQMELQQITQQLQQDLTRQLQEAVDRQRSTYTSSSTSSSSHSSQQNQAVLQELNNELKQNLTRNLQETLRQHYGNQGTNGGYTYTVTTGGVYSPTANYKSQDLDVLMKQMQKDLERQLQEQLSQQQGTYRQAYYTSGTSTSGQYNPNGYGSNGNGRLYSMGSDGLQSGSLKKYNQFHASHQGHSDVVDEDCMQGDAPYGYGHAQASQYSPYQYQRYGGYGNPQAGQHTDELGQQIDDSDDLTQQSEDELGQQLEDLDKLTQQTENDFGQLETESHHTNVGGYGQLQLGSQRREQSGQQIEDVGQITEDLDDLTQQTEDGFGKLEVGSHSSASKPHTGQQIEDLGQQLEDLDDLTQQTEDAFSKFEVGSQYSAANPKRSQIGQEVEDLGQQIEDLDQLTQQTEDELHDFEVASHSKPTAQYAKPQYPKPTPKSVSLSDILGQPTRNYLNKPQVGNHYAAPKPMNTDHVGQQTEDLDGLTQQTEDSFSQFVVGNQHKPQNNQPIGQQIDDSEGLTQQTEDSFGHFTVGNQQKPQNNQPIGQQLEDLDKFTQHTEDSFGHFTVGNQQKPQNNQPIGQQLEDLDGLTQRTEDSFGHFATGNHNKPQQVGQQLEDLDGLTQQTEDAFGNFVGGDQKNSQTENNFGKLEKGNQQLGHNRDVQQEENFGQQLEDLDGLTQQTEDGFGKLESGNGKYGPLGQQPEDLDGLTQQTEEGFGNLAPVGHRKPYTDQTEDAFGNFEVVGQRKPITKPVIVNQIAPVGNLPPKRVVSSGKLVAEENQTETSHATNEQSRTVHPGAGNLNQIAPNYDDEDLTQQIHQDFFGNVKPVSESGDDFIDHGDYLQHVGPRKHITHMENEGQAVGQHSSQNTGSISMEDARRMYVSRPQYANSPTEVQFTRFSPPAAVTPALHVSSQQSFDRQVTDYHRTMAQQTVNRQQPLRSSYLTGLNYGGQHTSVDDSQRVEDFYAQKPVEVPNEPSRYTSTGGHSSLSQKQLASTYNYDYNHTTQHQQHASDNQQVENTDLGYTVPHRPSTSYQSPSWGYSGSPYSSRNSYVQSARPHQTSEDDYQKPENLDSQRPTQPTPDTSYQSPSRGYSRSPYALRNSYVQPVRQDQTSEDDYQKPENLDSQRPTQPTPETSYQTPSRGYSRSPYALRNSYVQPVRQHQTSEDDDQKVEDLVQRPVSYQTPSRDYSVSPYSSRNSYVQTATQHQISPDDYQQAEDLDLQMPEQHTADVLYEPPSRRYSGSTYSSGNSYVQSSYGRRLETTEPKVVDELVTSHAAPGVYTSPLERRPEDAEPSKEVVHIDLAPSETEATETPEPKSFWQRVGGKISTSFNAAKQKAKDITEKINLG